MGQLQRVFEYEGQTEGRETFRLLLKEALA